jgi:uncharacterized metal-binding protein (TIGR02443 family)
MTEPLVTKKRFIAGAICPDCRVVDRIVVETAAATPLLPELSRRRCVSCEFCDEFSETSQRLSQAIPKGRAERAKNSDEQASKVRILEPGVGRKNEPGR